MVSPSLPNHRSHCHLCSKEKEGPLVLLPSTSAYLGHLAPGLMRHMRLCTWTTCWSFLVHSRSWTLDTTCTAQWFWFIWSSHHSGPLTHHRCIKNKNVDCWTHFLNHHHKIGIKSNGQTFFWTFFPCKSNLTGAAKKKITAKTSNFVWSFNPNPENIC